MAAEAKARKMVLISPEFIKAIMRKVTKKISAVPKSLMTISAPTHTSEKAIKAYRFLEV